MASSSAAPPVAVADPAADHDDSQRTHNKKLNTLERLILVEDAVNNAIRDRTHSKGKMLAHYARCVKRLDYEAELKLIQTHADAAIEAINKDSALSADQRAEAVAKAKGDAAKAMAEMPVVEDFNMDDLGPTIKKRTAVELREESIARARPRRAAK